MKKHKLLDIIWELPATERAELANALLESLNPTDSDIQDVWIEEVHRRMKDVKEGRATLIPGEEVMRKAQRIIEGPNKKGY